MNSEWLDQAECRGKDPSLWFPERGAPQELAKSICRRCVVREICLEENLTTSGGIYGGYNDRERRKMRIGRIGLREVETENPSFEG